MHTLALAGRPAVHACMAHIACAGVHVRVLGVPSYSSAAGASLLYVPPSPPPSYSSAGLAHTDFSLLFVPPSPPPSYSSAAGASLLYVLLSPPPSYSSAGLAHAEASPLSAHPSPPPSFSYAGLAHAEASPLSAHPSPPPSFSYAGLAHPGALPAVAALYPYAPPFFSFHSPARRAHVERSPRPCHAMAQPPAQPSQARPAQSSYTARAEKSMIEIRALDITR